MLRNEHEVIDQEKYQEIQNTFHMDNPSLDSVLSAMEEQGTVERMQIKGTKNEAVLFECPFRIATTCEYYRVETTVGDEDVDDIVEMLSTAGAAHIVTEHI